jgi:hypothetical protein
LTLPFKTIQSEQILAIAAGGAKLNPIESYKYYARQSRLFDLLVIEAVRESCRFPNWVF